MNESILSFVPGLADTQICSLSALALSLRVGGGTILPTRHRRGRSTTRAEPSTSIAPAIVPETIGPAIQVVTENIEPAIVPENIEPVIVPEQCITLVPLHNMDQLEELRGCDKRLAACMLD